MRRYGNAGPLKRLVAVAFHVALFAAIYYYSGPLLDRLLGLGPKEVELPCQSRVGNGKVAYQIAKAIVAQDVGSARFVGLNSGDELVTLTESESDCCRAMFNRSTATGYENTLVWIVPFRAFGIQRGLEITAELTVCGKLINYSILTLDPRKS